MARLGRAKPGLRATESGAGQSGRRPGALTVALGGDATFRAINPWMAATVLLLFAVFGMAISWRKSLLILSTFATLAALGTAASRCLRESRPETEMAKNEPAVPPPPTATQSLVWRLTD